MRASASGGKRISQNEFTEKAWQAVVAAPDIAKQYQQQIVVRAEAPCRVKHCKRKSPDCALLLLSPGSIGSGCTSTAAALKMLQCACLRRYPC